jgi:hypothetical protein
MAVTTVLLIRGPRQANKTSLAVTSIGETSTESRRLPLANGGGPSGLSAIFLPSLIYRYQQSCACGGGLSDQQIWRVALYESHVWVTW